LDCQPEIVAPVSMLMLPENVAGFVQTPGDVAVK
jgi:hypothetical protein